MAVEWSKDAAHHHYGGQKWLAGLTAEERQYVVDEIATRMKDIVFATADDLASQCVDAMEEQTGWGDNVITFKWATAIVALDLVQIVARKRRGAEASVWG